MRESFDSIGALMGCYRFVKYQVSGKASLMIEGNFSSDFLASKKSLENKFAFICDVETFVPYFCQRQKGFRRVPEDMLLHIFHLKFCKGASKYKGFRHMAQCIRALRKSGEVNIPERLQHHPNITRVADDMEDDLEEYFIKRGMIG